MGGLPAEGAHPGTRREDFMIGLRRALFFSITERYVAIALNFVMVATLARLLTPEEFGYSVIGAATIGFVECLRDFGTSGYLVQAQTVTRQATRTAFTVMLVLSLAVAGTLWLGAETIASFYHKEGLTHYLHVTALGLLSGPFAAPSLALLRRDLQFRSVAIINVASAVTLTGVTVLLALAGASYMSFAWGILAGAYVTAGLAILLQGDIRIFWPSVSDWRAVLSFGGYSSAAGMFGKLQEFVPSLIVGRLIGFDAVGLFSRAVMVCQLPDKCLLSGLMPVALPALAVEARAGRSLAAAYLKATTFITAVQWPALLLLACLAHPAVLILLGGQWESIVPLVQIIALGLLAAFPNVLAYPLLAASGGIRHAMLSALLTLLTSSMLALLTARWGLTAMALGVAATVSIQAVISLRLVRIYAPFELREMFLSLRKSAMVAGISTLVPLAAFAVNGFSFAFSPLAGIAIGIGAVIAWIIAIRLTRHALAAELNLVLDVAARALGSLLGDIRGRLAVTRRSQAET
ncbi:oligosaccharide flippase family protein [Ancylobacter crimeensis]|nr:oligosaccharide flippase family protein [Ancylobacter crimeensis]